MCEKWMAEWDSQFSTAQEAIDLSLSTLPKTLKDDNARMRRNLVMLEDRITYLEAV